MGQCVLRDLGFEFEKDPEKKKMLDEYLKEVPFDLPSLPLK
jgi:hypothetical protein